MRFSFLIEQFYDCFFTRRLKTKNTLFKSTPALLILIGMLLASLSQIASAFPGTGAMAQCTSWLPDPPRACVMGDGTNLQVGVEYCNWYFCTGDDSKAVKNQCFNKPSDHSVECLTETKFGSCPAGYQVLNGNDQFINGPDCGCPEGTRFFADIPLCENITELPPNESPPNNPSDNGPNCDQPSCGEPINLGTGNMWHAERDFETATADGQLSLVRTYNSSPYNWDAGVVRTFGVRWTQVYDTILKIEPKQILEWPSRSKCFRREYTQIVWCQNWAPTPTTTALPESVSIVRSDGKKYYFNRSGTSWIGNLDVNDRITANYNSTNTAILGWTYISAKKQSKETFDANGILIAMASRAGLVQRLTYSDGNTNDSNLGRFPADAPLCAHSQPGVILPVGKLLCVTDNWGRQLQFEYDGKGRIKKIIDPSQLEYLYSYDGPSGGCPDSTVTSNPACTANNLTQVTYPNNSNRTYYYNEASQSGGGACPHQESINQGLGIHLNLLTGIVDENRVRYISWTYDCLGQALSSQLGNVAHKVEVLYQPVASDGQFRSFTTTVSGTSDSPQITFTRFDYQLIEGRPKNTGISQACAECDKVALRTYDGNGNTTSRTDFNGNVVMYQYDLVRNLETRRIEASGTSQARIISTSWHPTYRLPLQIAGPQKRVTYTYDTNGNELTRTQQATTDVTGAAGFAAVVTGPARTWTQTYNTVGQVLTVTGPRADIVEKTTYTYDASGNLSTILNAVGHLITLSNYDANGRACLITDSNGATTTLGYTARGWLDTRTISAGSVVETTHYDYDGVGQIKHVTLPDGATIDYSYDDAHRLTDITDKLGNSIHYTLDNMDNRIKEEIKDTNGTLSRQVSRIYDGLNRLQQVTGGQQ